MEIYFICLFVFIIFVGLGFYLLVLQLDAGARGWSDAKSYREPVNDGYHGLARKVYWYNFNKALLSNDKEDARRELADKRREQWTKYRG